MSAFASGKHALGLCDRCGRQYKLKELKWQIIDMENSNLLVCVVCLDEDHPQYALGRFPVNDPQAIQNPRVDQDNDRSLWGWGPILGVETQVIIGFVNVNIS